MEQVKTTKVAPSLHFKSKIVLVINHNANNIIMVTIVISKYIEFVCKQVYDLEWIETYKQWSCNLIEKRKKNLQVFPVVLEQGIQLIM